MSGAVKMVVDDPSKFHLLTVDMKKQIIKGAQNTANVMAGKARKEAQKNIKENFTSRNSFTVNSVGFTPSTDSKYTSLKSIQSFVGIGERASYMARQEEGGKHTPRQGKTLAIPTDAARGGSFGNRVQRGMMVGDIRKKSKRVHGESAQRLPQYKGKGKIKGKKITRHTRASNTVSRAYIAHKNNLFMPFGGNNDQRNVFIVKQIHFEQVAGGKGSAERKRHRKVAFELKQIYNFEHSETMTQAKPWLMPACEKVAKDVEKIFISQMKKLGM